MRSWKYPKSSRWADLSVASLPPSSWNSGSSAAMHTVVGLGFGIVGVLVAPFIGAVLAVLTPE